MELGMLAEAAEELEKAPRASRDSTEFLGVQAELLQEQQDWIMLEKVARELCSRHPDKAGWWVMLAYSTRRAVSLEAAELILLDAVKLHPDDPTIVFNLGCYACQRGDLENARVRVARAIALEPHFKEVATADPDLEPLRRMST